MKERKQFNFAQRWKIAQQNLSPLAGSKRLGGPLLVCLGLVVVLALTPWLWQYKLDYQLKQLERYIADYQDVAALDLQVTELQAQRAKMNTFRQIMIEKKKDPQAIIAAITKHLPSASRMLSFALEDDNSIQITVILNEPSDITQLWGGLSNSDLFMELDISSVSMLEEQQILDLTLKLK
ncbi:MAG: hypothetical protein GX248_12360 [Peptococcaceae bacterium]|jgi:hypothetical protein|nr:hypothetical protein [Peptococcaceae bacterium]